MKVGQIVRFTTNNERDVLSGIVRVLRRLSDDQFMVAHADGINRAVFVCIERELRELNEQERSEWRLIEALGG